MTGAVERMRSVLLDGELARRLVHASGVGLPLLYLAHLTTWPQTQALFVLGAAVTLVLEALRHSGRIDWRIYEYLTREYEQETIAGYALYMVSSAAVVLVFEPTIALPALFMLMLADPISGMTTGDEFRRLKRPRSLVTMYLVSAVIAVPFLAEYPLAVVLGGLGATAADGYKPIVAGHVVDDNLTIPIVAASLMRIGVEVTALL